MKATRKTTLAASISLALGVTGPVLADDDVMLEGYQGYWATPPGIMFERLDNDGNNAINEGELNADTALLAGFDDADADNDGWLSRAEFEMLYIDLVVDEPETIDFDHGGNFITADYSRRETQQKMSQREPLHESFDWRERDRRALKSKIMFENMDTNEDDMVDRGEITNFPWPAGNFKKADTDGNGKLGYGEFRTYVDTVWPS